MKVRPGFSPRSSSQVAVCACDWGGVGRGRVKVGR